MRKQHSLFFGNMADAEDATSFLSDEFETDAEVHNHSDPEVVEVLFLTDRELRQPSQRHIERHTGPNGKAFNVDID